MNMLNDIEHFTRKVFDFIFGIFEPRVRVALMDHMDPKKSHGNVWVKAKSGTEMRRILIDKPRHLKHHDNAVIEDIFQQMEQMGLEVSHVEIKAMGVHRVYRAGDVKPQFEQRALPA